MKHPALGVALAGAIFGATGCFNVHGVDPGVRLIDNFDDGDFAPADPQFGPWKCNSFNPDNQEDYSCGRDDGDNGVAYSLALKFTITDPQDGIQQFGGASLYTSTIDPQDFTGFNELVFSAKLMSGVPALPSQAKLYAELWCQGASTEDGSVPGNLMLVQSVDYDVAWRTFTLSMANFAPPNWIPTPPGGGPEACLRQVNAIWFQVNLGLPDGQSGMGQLNIDDVYFR